MACFFQEVKAGSRGSSSLGSRFLTVFQTLYINFKVFLASSSSFWPSIFSSSADSPTPPFSRQFYVSQSCVLRANRAGEASSRVVRYVLPQTILFFAFLSVLIRCYSEEQDTSGQSRGAAAQRVCFIKCGFLELSTIATQEKKEGESQKHETPKHGSLIVFPPQMEVCFQQFFSSFFFFLPASQTEDNFISCLT